MTQQELLEKAKAKSLAHHFKKAAAHHEAKAGHHEKAADMHKAHADHHTEMMGKAEEDHLKAHHKASAAFHKSKAAHHEKMHKLHKAHAAHHEAMATAHEATDAEKVYKALEIEAPQEDTLSTTNDVAKTTPTAPAASAPAPAAPTAPAAAAAGAPASISENFGEYIQKALDKKLSESVDGAFERLLSSEDFNKRVDQEVAKKMLEKLGATTIETPIKTYAVPRPGESQGVPSTTVEKRYDGIREDLLDFVKSE